MRWSRFLSWAVLGALALGVVAMLGLVMYRQGVSAHERDMQHQEILALQAGMEEANARLEQLGQAPVPVPDSTTGTTVVPIGPTDADILAAVADYCAGGACRGFDGDDGADATGPTEADVLNAVTQYCAVGACIGPAGQTGPAGADGAAGTDGVDGQSPPPITAEEIAAAVAAYCANDACRGPAGADGADSTVPGPPGPACPEGYTAQTMTVLTRDDGAPVWREAVLCVPTTEGG